jgi:hypothetical protein
LESPLLKPNSINVTIINPALKRPGNVLLDKLKKFFIVISIAKNHSIAMSVIFVEISKILTST